MELIMDELKIEHLKGLSVISITKYLMNKFNLSHEEAYKKLLTSETYKILMNSESGLYLESDEYLLKAIDLEFSGGREKLYSYLVDN